MTVYAPLLHAVNVGGTGKLPMTTLTLICETIGFKKVKTYKARRQSSRCDPPLKTSSMFTLQKRGVIVRTATEIADTLARNPFTDSPDNRVMALFVDRVLPADPLDHVPGLKNEPVRSGKRELFALYPDGMAHTHLHLPLEKSGTARNMNTVAKLAEITAVM
ncbi:DUF1697 domain-containing protein [Granulibacter bethesdensis]|uniref:DUF1697 domain-containing protein n=1 Tax=Granulibacter bethesdensis TaxID=364410 RepID=UPI0003F2118D|nr:DUF1697 domain-containing protein [Granulibacter bethesdensis]AHJ65686.1 putative cytosolic protein [Granulibacter bethesdensis CGDNIH4]